LGAVGFYFSFPHAGEMRVFRVFALDDLEKRCKTFKKQKKNHAKTRKILKKPCKTL